MRDLEGFGRAETKRVPPTWVLGGNGFMEPMNFLEFLCLCIGTGSVLGAITGLMVWVFG